MIKAAPVGDRVLAPQRPDQVDLFAKPRDAPLLRHLELPVMMLAADPDNLTKHDIASEATWADKYRDENNRQDHYEQTKNWHFTDIEIDHPDLLDAVLLHSLRNRPAGSNSTTSAR